MYNFITVISLVMCYILRQFRQCHSSFMLKNIVDHGMMVVIALFTTLRTRTSENLKIETQLNNHSYFIAHAWQVGETKQAK